MGQLIITPTKDIQKIKNLKIALISLQKDAERVPPVGLVYLATYLNERCGMGKEDIRILEPNYCDIKKELAEFDPDLIGLSSMTVDYGRVIDFATKVKHGFNIPVIIGGVHISSLPQSLHKAFDIGVIGEGELTLAELVVLYSREKEFSIEELKKINGLVFWNNGKLEYSSKREPVANLDDLPIPNFKFVSPKYFKREEIPSISDVGIKGYLMSSRGCPYRCVFCSTCKFWGRMRFNSPEYTAKMTKRLIDDLGADFIKVMDDLFTVSPERLREIKKYFEKYGVLDKIKAIECQPRANLMTDELCVAMQDLKIKTLNFGFESGSDRMLKWLKQESVTVAMNMDAILLCEKYGFNAYGSLIYGSPGETIAEMELTNDFIDFAKRHNAKYLWSFIATPFPLTSFWDIALQRGKVSNDMDWNLLSHHNLGDPLLLDSDIDKEKFKETFLKGRNKLKWLKIRLITDFAIKNPWNVIKMVASEPSYYIPRVLKQVFKQ